MDDPFEQISSDLIRGCSERDFLEMRCPMCGSELTLTIHPHGRKFFVRCQKDSTHVAMHGESATPPEWWRMKVGSGWY
jgi:hypothetical protein